MRTYISSDEIYQYFDDHPDATIQDICRDLNIGHQRAKRLLDLRHKSERIARKRMMYCYGGELHPLPATKLPSGGRFAVLEVAG